MIDKWLMFIHTYIQVCVSYRSWMGIVGVVSEMRSETLEILQVRPPWLTRWIVGLLLHNIYTHRIRRKRGKKVWFGLSFNKFKPNGENEEGRLIWAFIYQTLAQRMKPGNKGWFLGFHLTQDWSSYIGLLQFMDH